MPDKYLRFEYEVCIVVTESRLLKLLVHNETIYFSPVKEMIYMSDWLYFPFILVMSNLIMQIIRRDKQ